MTETNKSSGPRVPPKTQDSSAPQTSGGRPSSTGKPAGVTSTVPVGAASILAPAAPAESAWKTVAGRGSGGPRRLENVTEEGGDHHGQPTHQDWHQKRQETSTKDEAKKTPSRVPLMGGSRPPVDPNVRKWSQLGAQGVGGPAGVPRSQSFSIGHPQDSFTEHAMKQAVRNAVPDELDPAMLAAADDEMTEEEYTRMIMERVRYQRSLSQNPLLAQRRGSAQGLEGGSVWRGGSGVGAMGGGHRRSVSTASTGPPPGLNSGSAAFQASSMRRHLAEAAAEYDALKNQRRFSLAPAQGMASGSAYASSRYTMNPASAMSNASLAGLAPEYAHLAYRRHSLAGTAPQPHTASHSAAYRHLSDALDHLQLDEFRRAQYGGLAAEDIDEYFDPEARRKSIADVGKGVPLSTMPSSASLFIVEFKAGRSDLFYAGEGVPGGVTKGDLVIVEADRGKDLGKVVNDSITPLQVQQLQQQQAELLPDLVRSNKELHPKRIYRLAQPGEVAMLVSKSQDEVKALQVCQAKVRQKGLPMEVVDAEYQWDRRKLTFYFVADRRIDFRELVRELFKIYKTRIWMCAVNPAAATGAVPGVTPKQPQPHHQATATAHQ